MSSMLNSKIVSTLHRVVAPENNTAAEKLASFRMSTVFKLKGRPEAVGPRNEAEYLVIN